MAKKNKVEWRHRTKPAAISLATQFVNISFIIFFFIQLFWGFCGNPHSFDRNFIASLRAARTTVFGVKISGLILNFHSMGNQCSDEEVFNHKCSVFCPSTSKRTRHNFVDEWKIYTSTSKNHWRKIQWKFTKNNENSKATHTFFVCTHKNKQ